jgi:hypothetical protein
MEPTKCRGHDQKEKCGMRKLRVPGEDWERSAGRL